MKMLAAIIFKKKNFTVQSTQDSKEVRYVIQCGRLRRFLTLIFLASL